MKTSSLKFLKQLLDTPGPSGFEIEPSKIWRKEAGKFAREVKADVAGNSMASVGTARGPRVMLTGHIDEIGIMIVHIDDEGFLYFTTIGGWDPQVLVGQRVEIISRDGPVPGVIGKKAVHLLSEEDRETVTQTKDMWIDIGAADKDEAKRMVRVGDPAVLSAHTQELPNGLITSRSIDNRIGAFVVLEALRILSRKKPRAQVVAVVTTQEEIAWTGGGARISAQNLNPAVALVVDVTHATDHPSVEKKRVGEYKLGGGPVLSRGSSVNPVVFDMLVQTAEAEKIPYTLQAAARDTGTDADAIFNVNSGVPTGLVSVANRYMHSPNEMVALKDLERAAELLAAFALRVTSKTDFTPR